jgi:hypothetical protein
MHEIEPSSFCTIREYKQHIERRKQASDVSLGGLYLVLAALRDGAKGKEAFKFPVRMKLIELGDMQVANLTIDFLDLDLRPTGEVTFAMQDGIANDPGIIEKSTTQIIKEMYIRDYEDYMSGGSGKASIEEEIFQPELVGV